MADRIKVLIVDDIPETRDHLSKLLGFEADVEVVGAAAGGLEAIEMATTLHPDVVLMDIRMPVLDGIEATRRIVAAQHRHPFPHADQAVAGSRPRRASCACVADLERDRSLLVPHRHVRPRRPGVLERVRERLLDDPVGGELDAERQLAPLSLDLELDRQSGLGHLRGEAGKLRK